MLSADMKITVIGRNALICNKGSEDDKLCIKLTSPFLQFIAY